MPPIELAKAAPLPSAGKDSEKNMPTDGTGLIMHDPWLEPFADDLRQRYAQYRNWVETIEKNEGGFDNFSRGYEHYGLNVQPNGDIVYR
jgi:1,4-alpha-glucan branching enzyme